MSDREEIRAAWMRLNREVQNPLPGNIPWDEPFGRLADWLDADGVRVSKWNVVPIVARPNGRIAGLMDDE